MIDEFEVYDKALETWGEELQIIKTMEECGELIQICGKYLIQDAWKTENAIKLIREATDVQLMLNQIRHSIFKNNQILFIEAKIEALQELRERLHSSALKVKEGE